MARFDVYRHQSGSGYLLDCQADVLSELSTRLVVPLLQPTEGPPRIGRLNPAFCIEDKDVVMYTQYVGSIPTRELDLPVASLAEQNTTIMNALNMLISGF